MAQTFQARILSPGRMVDYTPSGAVAAGAVVVQSVLPGVAREAIAASRLGALCVEGVMNVVKVNGGINAGALVYWDEDGNPQGGTAGTGALTTSAGGNIYMGHCLIAAGANDEFATIWKQPSPAITNTIHNDLSNVIADPEDAGAIPITETGECPLVSSGAETRTLAAPTYAGQQLLLHMKTDGGNITLTCATGLNQTGNNTAVFGDAGDMLLLAAVNSGSNLRWRVVANDTVTLSTV